MTDIELLKLKIKNQDEQINKLKQNQKELRHSYYYLSQRIASLDDYISFLEEQMSEKKDDNFHMFRI